MGFFRPAVWAVAAVLLGHGTLVGQDTHVWSHRYGARSTLLGGAVIAGVDDASAAFYNPGALANVEQGDLFEGTRIFEFTKLTFHSELDETVSLDSDDFGRAPSFLGGVIPTGWKKHVLSYTMFKRQAFDLRSNIAVEGMRDVVARSPGEEAIFSNVKIDNKLSEQWVGFGWSYSVSPQVGVGLSTFVARRSQRGFMNASAGAVLSNGDIATSRHSDFFKYTHYRLVWKAGIAIGSERGQVGLTFTSPSFGVRGRGEREVVETRTGLDSDQDGVPESVLESDYQDNVGANYKAPVSIGVGYSLRLDGRAIHLSAEWYRRIAPYNVVHVAEAVGQTTGEPIDNNLSGATDGVLNAAVGVEQTFSASLKGFASFATDFSTAIDDAESTLSITRWDLYHLTSGARLRIGRADLTLGVGYIFGSEESPRSRSLVDIDETNFLFGRTALTELSYRRIQFIVGLSVKT